MVEQLVKSGKSFDKAIKLSEIEAEKKAKNERRGKGGRGRSFGSWNLHNNFKSSSSSSFSSGFQGGAKVTSEPRLVLCK